MTPPSPFLADQPPLEARNRVPCPCCGATRTANERTLVGYRLERCRSCDLVFVNPRPSDQALTRLYLEKAPETQADFYAKTVSNAQVAEYDRILRDLVGLLPGRGCLLDVGCAAGYFMQRAARAGFEAHGIDLAPWVVEIAARRHVPNVRTGLLRDVTFPDASFDVVHASQVVEHLPQPIGELTEIRRILRPGGLLYINVPNYQCLSIVLGRDDFELNKPPEHVAYFTPRTLARMVSTAGFSVIRTSSYGGLKWENLLGWPIRSEIAEAARASGATAAAPGRHPHPNPMRREPSMAGRIARTFFYKRLQVGMTLEIFARHTGSQSVAISSSTN
jgi:2-polyprenyl-3-methyl-5-hydroxy-6-metoxy-1,4-benzoquinol methylase